ncbi:hypothetical protein [Cupriavidus nantongensis]|uniref:hypothetical protein n=1 Tax=Cupriavidus nantongensis TaxID=1796606 RepID=UPI0022476C61|nr:hypothetical protein [Cupriavidus nantongensis]
MRTLGEKNACYDLNRKGVFPFAGLDEEILVLNRMMLVASAKLNVASDSRGIGIVATYEVALPRYADGSRLVIAFTAIDEKGKRKSVGEILCEDGKPNATRSTISAKLTGMKEGPILKIEPKSSVMRLSGMFATMQESFITKAINRFSSRPDVIYAERFEMVVDYWPDRNNMKMLQTSLVIARPEK